MQYTIRPIRKDDIAFLWEMLYESLFVQKVRNRLVKILLMIRSFQNMLMVGDKKEILDL